MLVCECRKGVMCLVLGTVFYMYVVYVVLVPRA